MALPSNAQINRNKLFLSSEIFFPATSLGPLTCNTFLIISFLLRCAGDEGAGWGGGGGRNRHDYAARRKVFLSLDER